MDTPPISVVVPVYNGAENLGACLDALRGALPEGGEILVVDDGSDDGTPEIASRFDVTLILHHTNRGTSAARNTGWRAARADRIAFVDADVAVHPRALHRMMAWLDSEPDRMGVNGILALAISTPGLITAFANSSIHYQHRRHGPFVASAFTSVCLMRREALERLGGWDERWFSRYGDDVSTRFSLPDGAIRMDPDVTGEHLKAVRLRGLLKHRFNVSYHFIRICRSNVSKVARRPGSVVLHWRYPLNTLAAAMALGCAGATAVAGPLSLPLWTVPLTLFGAANADFFWFTLRERGAAEALASQPLSAAEGFAFFFGMALSELHRARGKG